MQFIFEYQNISEPADVLLLDMNINLYSNIHYLSLNIEANFISHFQYSTIPFYHRDRGQKVLTLFKPLSQDENTFQ